MQLGRRFPVAILSSSLVTLADEWGGWLSFHQGPRLQLCQFFELQAPRLRLRQLGKHGEGGVVAYAGAKRLQAESTITNDDHHHLHDTLAAFRQFPCPPHRAGSPRASSTTHTSPPLLMPDAHSEPPVDDVRRDIFCSFCVGRVL